MTGREIESRQCSFLSLKTFCSFAWTNYLKVLANTLCTIGNALVSNSARRNGHIVYLRNVRSPVRIPPGEKMKQFRVPKYEHEYGIVSLCK
jgi:hypothetical protein